MNENQKRVPTEFGPEIRFEVRPAPPARDRAERNTELEQLKNRLLRERLDEVWDPQCGRPLRHAADEAAALAWVTAYPLLVFPALFEEKALAAVLRAERQDQVRQRSRQLLAI